jgi:hypothetical protein
MNMAILLDACGSSVVRGRLAGDGLRMRNSLEIGAGMRIAIGGAFAEKYARFRAADTLRVG